MDRVSVRGLGLISPHYRIQNRSPIKILLYSTGNNIQYLIITYNGEEREIHTHTHTRVYIYIYVYN